MLQILIVQTQPCLRPPLPPSLPDLLQLFEISNNYKVAHYQIETFSATFVLSVSFEFLWNL